jgi:hypothetical protein
MTSEVTFVIHVEPVAAMPGDQSAAGKIAGYQNFTTASISATTSDQGESEFFSQRPHLAPCSLEAAATWSRLRTTGLHALASSGPNPAGVSALRLDAEWRF